MQSSNTARRPHASGAARIVNFFTEAGRVENIVFFTPIPNQAPVLNAPLPDQVIDEEVAQRSSRWAA
jgi:hypothetical protein